MSGAKPSQDDSGETPPHGMKNAAFAQRARFALAGLAAGLGLAALASHFGFGEQLANMMMIGLLIMVVMVVMVVIVVM